MLIANPIYDAVFKYMMDDLKVAKLLLSAIIGEEIIKLDFRPTELKFMYKDTITIYHIDFVAKIKTANKQEKLVILEVQKAKFPTDIIRFRKYLGQQYIDPKNVQEVNEQEEEYGKPFPIISIYFLGHKLEYAKAPVIKVQREYMDVTTGKIIKEKEEFIECLTHDSYIIQISFLKKNRKTELLKILSIFDQSNRNKDYHILNVNENDFPEKYREIIRRLQMARVDEEVVRYMEAEVFYLSEFQRRERLVADLGQKIEVKKNIILEQELEIKDKEKVIEDKKKVIEDKEKVIEDKEKEIKEKDLLIAQLLKKIKK